MAFKIAIASGKGGTGKTTVSVNLYHKLNQVSGHKAQLIDCDVEEPNDLLLFQHAKKESAKKVQQFVPKIDLQLCSFCKLCVDYCEFNAISIIPTVKHAEITASLCHSCGACLIACTGKAIYETPQEIGQVNTYQVGYGNGITEGRLKIGSALQTTVIKTTKKEVKTNSTAVLFDAPPGTSCSVVETVADADYVILVTEPTPFGLHDMKLMTQLLDELAKPFGIIINKEGLGNKETQKFIEKSQFELLGKIPFSQKYASNYATGLLTVNIPDEIDHIYKKIVDTLLKKIGK